ncbi:MAG: hypothetical protein ABIN58_11580 [candidate division WOR-3 bacterium]
MIGQTWFWVYARLPDGKAGLYGPAADYQSAANIAYAKCPDCEWEIIELPTRDPSRAGQILRARRLQNEGIYLSDVMKPMKRK